MGRRNAFRRPDEIGFDRRNQVRPSESGSIAGHGWLELAYSIVAQYDSSFQSCEHLRLNARSRREGKMRALAIRLREAATGAAIKGAHAPGRPLAGLEMRQSGWQSKGAFDLVANSIMVSSPLDTMLNSNDYV